VRVRHRNEKERLNWGRLLTVILHVQRRGRILLVDPSTIIQKPYRNLFVFFPREAKQKEGRHDISTRICGERGEESKTKRQIIMPVGADSKRNKSAPDAADVFSDLIRVRTLELGQLCGALDLEVYLFPRSRDDLERNRPKKRTQHTTPLLLLSSIRR
jgi:hypothetical protein